jgi:hypothetical protein
VGERIGSAGNPVELTAASEEAEGEGNSDSYFAVVEVVVLAVESGIAVGIPWVEV